MKKRQISLKELLAMVSLEELDLARNQDLPRETSL
jgi:hypothetical protein